MRKKNESDIVKEERQPPTRWVARLKEWKNPPRHRSKFRGGFSMPTLFSKREDKCKQCQNKKSKGHKILKGKKIHKHHLHSKKNGASTTLQHGCRKYCNITNKILQEIKKSYVSRGYEDKYKQKSDCTVRFFL